MKNPYFLPPQSIWKGSCTIDQFRLCAQLKIASRPLNFSCKLHLLDFQSRNISRVPQPG